MMGEQAEVVERGRGFDGLPPEVLDGLAGTLVATITVPELRRALAADLPAVQQVQPLVEELGRSTP